MAVRHEKREPVEQKVRPPAPAATETARPDGLRDLPQPIAVEQTAGEDRGGDCIETGLAREARIQSLETLRGLE